MSETNITKLAEADEAALLDTICHPRKRAFLLAYATVGTINGAAKCASIERHSHYHWLQTDEAYVAAFARAKECAADSLIFEAQFRATKGLRKYKFDKQGVPIMWLNPDTNEMEHYFEDQRSDVLLMFLIKGVRPEEYSDKHMHAHKHAHKHDHKHDINITTPHILEDMRQLRKRLQAQELDQRPGPSAGPTE